jgi:hypothetical protein
LFVTDAGTGAREGVLLAQAAQLVGRKQIFEPPRSVPKSIQKEVRQERWIEFGVRSREGCEYSGLRDT